MIRRLVLCLLLLTSVCLLPAPAQAGPSYRKVAVPPPEILSWRDGIPLRFELDREACRRTYGERWPEECSSAPLGQPGAPAEGVRLSPETPGSWRWSDGDVLRFQPAAPAGALRPGTTYTVDLSGLRLPARVRTDRQNIRFTTQPQAVNPGKERVWIDPSPAGAHSLSLPLTFIWPADRKAVEAGLRLEPESPGLQLGPPELVWNADGDRAMLSCRLLRLAEGPARVRLSFPNLPLYADSQKDGRRILQGDTGRSFGVPGRTDLLQIRQIELTRGHDENLNPRLELHLTASLRLDPQALLRHMTLLELPERAEPGAAEPTDWTKFPAVRLQDVQNSRPLEPRLVSPDEASDDLRFVLPVRPGRCVLLFVEDGLASEAGPTLARPVLRALKAPDEGAELSFLLPGQIMSLAGSRRIPLHCAGIESISWRARRVRAPFLAHFAATRNMSAETMTWQGAAELDDTAESREGRLAVPAAEAGRASFPLLDIADFLPPGEQGGLVLLELTGLRQGREAASARRLILLTDMGLTVKEDAEGRRHVYVQDLRQGTPVQGAEVTLLARNGTTLSQAMTGREGSCVLPSARGLSSELEPVAVLARKPGEGADMAWLSLKDPSRVLDMGPEALAGRHVQADGLMASVFSQRGLYMPGDTLHFGILIRRADWRALPGKLPLEAVLTGPAGRVVQRTPLEGDLTLTETSWTSTPESPAGPYTLDVRLREEKGHGPVIGSATVRVEEFEPDTLALSAELLPAEAGRGGWIQTGAGGEAPRVRVSLRTLYGDAARGHRLSATLRAEPSQVRVPDHPGFLFCDPTPQAGEPRSIRLPELVTDEKGEAVFTLPDPGLAGSSLASFRVEGFEAAGGRAVARQLSVRFSPLKTIVGWKPLQEAGTLSRLRQNAPASLRLLALDASLRPKALSGVSCTLSGRRWINSLVRDARGEFHYESAPLDRPLEKTRVTLPAEGLTLPLRTGTPGDYVLTLTGEGGETLLTVPYSVAGRNIVLSDGTSSAPLTDGNLRPEIVSGECVPGQDLALRISAPFAGTGLITIERETVLAHSWFQAEAGESVQRIRIPADFEGEGRVSVIFSRSASSDAIYLNPLAHASLPFACGLSRRDMGLKLELPPSVLPGGDLSIRLSSARPGRALLFAVDEGVLSLTGFATPDPLKDLLTGRALDVVTRQAFDLLMPDQARLRGRLPAFGGDTAGAGGRFLNPFRRRGEPPFARWLGMVETDGNPKTVRVPVPAWLSGKIRVMAVGTGGDRDLLLAGSAEASCPVRGSLILRPLLPLAAVPGDVIEAALGVANTVPGSGKAAPVTLRLRTDPGLEILGDEAPPTLRVDENGESVLPLRLRVTDAAGNAALHAEATLTPSRGPAVTVSRSQSLSLRPASNLVTAEETGPLTESRDIDVSRDRYPVGLATRLSVAGRSLSDFRALAARLADYPFGCTEQRISRAFPVLAALARPKLAAVLSARPDLPPAERGKLEEEKLREALGALRSSFQEGRGAALWEGGEPDDLVTVYAADFLLSLSESGRGAPPDLLQGLRSCLRGLLWRDPQSLQDARVRAYACWVLLRSGDIVTQDAERLMNWLEQSGLSWREDVTASLLADCLAMLRRDRDARALLPGRLGPFQDEPGGIFDAGCALALHAHILSRPHWRNGEKPVPDTAVREAMDQAAERAMRSLSGTMAMALTTRALSAGLTAPEKAPKVSLSCLEPEGAESRIADLPGLSEISAPACRRFRAQVPDGAGDLAWRLVTGGYDRKPPQEVRQGMEVRRRYLDAQGRAVTQAREGDLITVEISLRSDRPYSNVALTDLLPGGLEPLLDQTGCGPAPEAGAVHSERREDRYLFFGRSRPDPVLYVYRTRAVTAGEWRIPACTAEAMYAPEIHALVSGGIFTVTRRP